MIYAAYIQDPGPVLAVVRCSKKQAKHEPRKLIHCALDVSDETHYVDGGLLCRKSHYNVPFKQEGLTVTLSDVPEGTVVATDAVQAVADASGSVAIHYDVPGTKHITLSGHFRYIDTALEGTVDDA